MGAWQLRTQPFDRKRTLFHMLYGAPRGKDIALAVGGDREVGLCMVVMGGGEGLQREQDGRWFSLGATRIRTEHLWRSSACTPTCAHDKLNLTISMKIGFCSIPSCRDSRGVFIVYLGF